MAGYSGFSMSNNAIAAYSDGEKPLSKWSKKEVLEILEDNGVEILRLKKVPAKILKSILLYKSSWHHTSSWYNKTNFYSLDIDKAKTISDEEITRLVEAYKSGKDEQKNEYWLCEYLEWSGSRKHPKATEVRAEGVVKGNWLYLNNGKKKSVSANGFKFIRRLEKSDRLF